MHCIRELPRPGRAGSFAPGTRRRVFSPLPCFLVLIWLVLIWPFPGGRALAGDETVTILVTTDVHGHVAEDPDQGIIGFALLKGYMDALRKKGDTVYLLDCGDMVSGGAYAQADQGRSVARLMGLIGYTVMVPGNHAFDYNAATGDPGYFFKTLVPLVVEGAPAFAATAVNILRRGKAPRGLSAAPVVIHGKTGPASDRLRIIVAGVITPETGRKPARKLLQEYDFGWSKKPAEVKKRLLSLLEAAITPYSRPNDVLLVLSHVGYNEAMDKKNQLTGKDLALLPNVDFVLDGHTHQRIAPERIGRAWYAQGGSLLRQVTQITLRRGKGGALERDIRLLDYADMRGVAPSAPLSIKVAQLGQGFGFREPLFDASGAPKGYFSRKGLRWRSTALGLLGASGLRFATGADIGLCTASSFKADIVSRALKAQDVKDSMPLAGALITATVKGRDLARIFSALLVPGAGSFPQFHGLEITAEENRAGPRKPYRVLSVTLENGVAPDPDGDYVLAFNSRVLNSLKKERDCLRDMRGHGDVAEVLAAYWKTRPDYPWRDICAVPTLRLVHGR